MIEQSTPQGGGQQAVFDFVLDRLRTSSSYLDVGSGDGKYTHSIVRQRKDVGRPIDAWVVDAHWPTLDRIMVPPERKIHGILPDILREVPDLSMDGIICLDVIEHLEKTKSIEMIRNFDRIARQVIVLFTPLGFMPQPGTEENPFLEHLCGFEPEDLEALGYQTTAWRKFDYGNNLIADALWGVKWP